MNNYKNKRVLKMKCALLMATLMGTTLTGCEKVIGFAREGQPPGNKVDFNILDPNRFSCSNTLSTEAEYDAWFAAHQDDAPTAITVAALKAQRADFIAAVRKTNDNPVPTTFTSATLQDTGHGDNRIDIVYLGDGFTSTTSDQETYRDRVETGFNELFSDAYFSEYQNYYNVFRVDVISQEAGIDYWDSASGSYNTSLKNTPLQMGFGCNNYERMLCVGIQSSYEAASQAVDSSGDPVQWDQILVLGNASDRAGRAIYLSEIVGMTGDQSGQIGPHELGHSFAKLGDEYTENIDVFKTFVGQEFDFPNVTKYKNSDKWARWIGEGSGDMAVTQTPWEGAAWWQTRAFRPNENSKMRSSDEIGIEFGPVNLEQLIMKMYQYVSPIDDATAGDTHPLGTLLSVTPMEPLHPLSIQWWVDGVLTNQTGELFDTSVLPSGSTHTVAVRVSDNWAYSSSKAKVNSCARNELLRDERIWTITP